MLLLCRRYFLKVVLFGLAFEFSSISALLYPTKRHSSIKQCIRHHPSSYIRMKNPRTGELYTSSTLSLACNNSIKQRERNNKLSPPNVAEFVFLLLSLFFFSVVMVMVVHFLLLHQNLECCKIPFGSVAAKDDPNSWVRLTIQRRLETKSPHPHTALLHYTIHRHHNYLLLPTHQQQKQPKIFT